MSIDEPWSCEMPDEKSCGRQFDGGSDALTPEQSYNIKYNDIITMSAEGTMEDWPDR